MSLNQNEYYKAIVEKLIEQLKAGTAPWQKPWNAGQPFMPHNPVSGTRYKGGNSIALMCEATAKGYDDSRWMTYEQAKKIGAQVRRGEKGTLLRFYKFTDDIPVLDEEGKPKINESGEIITKKIQLESPQVFSFVVFNASQIEGVPPPTAGIHRTEFEINQRAERILISSGAKISLGGARAYYNYQSDEIRLPLRESFVDDASYYATSLHELGHWTGHSSRLDRDMRHPFGSVGYAKEELRAEIFSMMLGDDVGLGHDPGQHAAYVESWIKVLSDDHREIFRAAADAEKIMGFIMELEKENKIELSDDICLPILRLFDVNGELVSESLQPHLAPIDMHMEARADFEPESRQDGLREEEDFVSIKDIPKHLIDKLLFDIRDLSYRATWDPHDLDVVLATLSHHGLVHTPSHADANRVYLDVPYSSKNEAKELGAKWDKEQKAWYAPAGSDLTKFDKWLKQPEPQVPIENPGAQVSEENTYLGVPYLERQKVKALGAKWDKEQKAWYAPAGSDLTKFENWLTKKTPSPLLNPVEEFSAALKDAGLVLDGPPIMDGTFQRVAVEGGKRGAKDGVYKAHLDGRPAGYIENFLTGVKTNWKAQGYSLSETEKARLKAEAASQLKERQKDREQLHMKASADAKNFLKALGPVHSDHPYMFRKQLTSAHGALLNPSEMSIVLPITDVHGETWSYQKIYEDGSKAFMPRGRVSGCFFVASPSSFRNIENSTPKTHLRYALGRSEIYVAEGYATAASISEALGVPVIAALSSGNLEEVAKALREVNPRTEIVICGDDDKSAELKRGHNPGREKALSAAKAVGGKAVFPIFPPGMKGSDFNDLQAVAGLDVLKDQLKNSRSLGRETKKAQTKEQAAGLSLSM